MGTACLTREVGESVGVRDVGRNREWLRETPPDQLGVHEEAGAVDPHVRQRSTIPIEPLDVVAQLNCCALRQHLRQEPRRLTGHALHGPGRGHGLRRVDADQPDPLLGLDDEGVAIDDSKNGSGVGRGSSWWTRTAGQRAAARVEAQSGQRRDRQRDRPGSPWRTSVLHSAVHLPALEVDSMRLGTRIRYPRLPTPTVIARSARGSSGAIRGRASWPAAGCWEGPIGDGAPNSEPAAGQGAQANHDDRRHRPQSTSDHGRLPSTSPGVTADGVPWRASPIGRGTPGRHRGYSWP